LSVKYKTTLISYTVYKEIVMTFQPLQLDIDPDRLPSEESMRRLDIGDKEFGDFVKAYKYSIWRSQGLSISAACRKVGIARSTMHEERWQVLLSKAQRTILGELSTNITAGNNYVFDNWQQMLNMAVADALNPATPARDRVDVMEFLYMSVIQPAKENSKDDSPERAYLQQLNTANFNPLQNVLNLQLPPGTQIKLEAPHVPIPLPRPADTIDAELVAGGPEQAADSAHSA
jgi:hypothetical protein